jgi:hypothetical protein
MTKLAEMAKSKQKTTRNRDDAARLEFAIMEPVKENSFYPKPQEIVNLLRSERVARDRDDVSLSRTFCCVLEDRMGSNPQVFCATQLQRMRSNGQAFNQHALPNQLSAPGLGGGLGRGLGVARDLGLGVGLGDGVGLAVAVAVGVDVTVAVAVGVGVDVGLEVAVAVTVAVAVAEGVGVGVPSPTI